MAATKRDAGFTDVEKAAMKDRAKELKAEERMTKNREEGEKAVLEKIAEMPDSDRVIATRVHELVKEVAPDLMPKTWYGMPTYTKDGKNICFFQSAAKFNARYATLGFDESANLDEGNFWPTSFAVTKLTDDVEKKIKELIKKAIS